VLMMYCSGAAYLKRKEPKTLSLPLDKKTAGQTSVNNSGLRVLKFYKHYTT
jgi:hypothetical protein